jgi:hypothetical protein
MRSSGVSDNYPYIPVIRRGRECAHFAGRKSVDIVPDSDLILVSTPQDAYRRIDFAVFGIPVVDTRHILQHVFQ